MSTHDVDTDFPFPKVCDKRTTTTAFIANVGGGIGKTTVAQALVNSVDETYGEGAWKLATVDDQNTSGDAGFITERVDLRLGSGADIRAVEDDAQAALEHFDDLGQLILTSNVIVDQGANVQRPILEWMTRSRIITMADQRGVGFDLIVPVDQTPKGLDGGLWCLENYAAAFAKCKVRPRYFVVLNDRLGKPFESAGESYEAVLAKAKALKAGIIKVPYGRSKMLFAGLQKRMTPFDAYAHREELATAMGIRDHVVKYERECFDLADFIVEVTEAVAKMVPPKKD